MKNPTTQLAQSREISKEVAKAFEHRTTVAAKHLAERVRQAGDRQLAALVKKPLLPWQAGVDAAQYGVDFAQRAVLLWDGLRQRGNNFIEHERQGLPPMLHFAHEMVMDGRTMERPVNYALLRIVPPDGVKVDARRRPYLIIDPRGGHGPGIGGFKEDSEVGVALAAGHPVYFVIFFRDPEPGQTLVDVCNAEREFVRCVHALHSDAPKPAIVGNCQGGWAAMMLAAANPDDTGPLVVVGAPMSYWGGAWSEGAGDNPMRYAGGLLGGTWLASLTSDLGAGKFDGAWLVQNFENLNPANTFWDKYYHVFANADTEPERFLEFERWWGGYFLLNREEIEWITQNLFVGNRLWAGEHSGAGMGFDLRDVKVPIVLFASLGDNITPPQQAFNWVADVYGSTEEIKARGQVIVGLMHQDIGHLGIFVSGRVAKKEHAQIVSALQSIETLPPGLYGMEIAEQTDDAGKTLYDVSFVEIRLEDVVARLNHYRREDEKPFHAMKAVSEFNQRAYELFGRPVAQALSSEAGAALGRAFHPLRFQRWALSDLNPFTWWLAPAAQQVKAARQAVAPDHPLRQLESTSSELISASLDGWRALRDAMGEAAFFQVYGNMFALYGGDQGFGDEPQAQPLNPRDLPFVKQALAAIDQGGYAEALARVTFLMAHEDTPLPLSRLHLAHELIEDYGDLLPQLPLEEIRRIGGEQEIIARYEPQQALATLPVLLARPQDRKRLLTLLERVLADRRVQRIVPSAEQTSMLARIRSLLVPVVPAIAAPATPSAPSTRVRRRTAAARRA